MIDLFHLCTCHFRIKTELDETQWLCLFFLGTDGQRSRPRLRAGGEAPTLGELVCGGGPTARMGRAAHPGKNQRSERGGGGRSRDWAVRQGVGRRLAQPADELKELPAHRREPGRRQARHAQSLAARRPVRPLDRASSSRCPGSHRVDETRVFSRRRRLH